MYNEDFSYDYYYCHEEEFLNFLEYLQEEEDLENELDTP